MRSALASLLLLTACGGSSSAPPPHTLPAPDAAKLATMSWDDRCAAVAPRAIPCLDELLIADAAALDPALADAIKQNLADKPAASAKGLDVMHQTECAADDDYPFAVITCWNRPDCTQFATCVNQEITARASKRRAALPHEPADLGEPAAPDESQERAGSGR